MRTESTIIRRAKPDRQVALPFGFAVHIEPEDAATAVH
jgi:hypothetical protein